MVPTASGDGRGASDLVGTVLLLGLVITAAVGTVVVGTRALDQATEQRTAAGTTETLRTVDAEVASLVQSDTNATTTLDFGGEGTGNLDVVRSGQVNITLNGNPTCRGTIPLSSVRYQQDGQQVAFEGGGLWRGSEGGGSSMLTPPDVNYRNGTLTVTIVNITGTADRAPNEVAFLRDASTERSEELTGNVITTPCQRPDSIRIDVQSDFYGAWAEYFRSDLPIGTVSEFDNNDTARLFVGGSEFPARLNLTRNRVVNLSDGAPYMTGDAGDGTPVNVGSNSITFEKDTDTTGLETFQANVRPLNRAQIPNVTYLVNDSETRIADRTREPIDVVFVMDESGSMAGSKIDGAREAAKEAVGIMNTSVIGDRAGIVGYTSYPAPRYPNDKFLSNDSEELNDTINGLAAGGGTDLAGGLNQSIAILDTARTDQSEGYIFLLTDGENSPSNERCDQYSYSGDCVDHFDERTKNAARIAAKRGYTVYTFAYGSGADDDLLEEVADITGGEFSESGDASALSDVFAETIEDITQENQQFVARRPISTEVTSDGVVRPPQVPGASDGIVDNVSVGGNTYININDPAAPASFSHTFTIDDGETVTFDARTFNCNQEDGYEATGAARTVNGTEYPVARCTNVTTTGDTLGGDDVTVYTDGENAAPLLENDDTNQTLERYVDSSDDFTLESNEAVVRFDFAPKDDVRNDLFVLYSVGRPESSIKSQQLLRLGVRIVEF
jgi:Mg-chelatase subunit ChlD